MAKVRHVKLLITLNPMAKVPKTVPHWQEELYVTKFGEEAVTVVGEEVIERELPDAASEAPRLREEFGIDPDEKQAYFDMVYGRGRQGVNALAAAIEERPKAKRRKPEADGGDEGDKGSGDPLAST